MREFLGRRWLKFQGLAWLTAAALLVSCGGGGVESGGTGMSAGYSSGAITGFGSVVVNGVHFDESTARIHDADGNTLSRDALRLGMTVEIQSGAIDNTALTATAQDVNVISDLLGPVSAVDLTASTMTVLGQTVRITASTLFDSSLAGGLSAIALGQKVEVYAIFDPVNTVYAARLVLPRSNPDHYTLRGVVSGWDSAQRQFQMGPATLTYAADAVPAGLANGATLRLRLSTQADGSGRWVVTTAQPATYLPADGTEAEIEAVVSSYTSLSNFVVAGVTVDASAAQLNANGLTLAAGVRVEVEGRMQGTVLKATKLELKGSEDSAGGDDSGSGQEFELSGLISGLDTTAQTFVIRTQTVSYAQAAFEPPGTAANLANGLKVEVKGVRSSDGTLVTASEVKFDD
ncbi:DUF5666 domain-containing protein [Ideonella dechloratans]|uniref:DUF5666 domain-containing protein n=1 Tax=Ideonella dechloratans TaxID=36863 RepID=UPI0035B32ADC